MEYFLGGNHMGNPQKNPVVHHHCPSGHGVNHGTTAQRGMGESFLVEQYNTLLWNELNDQVF